MMVIRAKSRREYSQYPKQFLFTGSRLFLSQFRKLSTVTPEIRAAVIREKTIGCLDKRLEIRAHFSKSPRTVWAFIISRRTAA